MFDGRARHKELVDSQSVILRALDEVKMVIRNEAASRAKAELLYGWMVQYISRQDEEFYTSLRQQHEKNPAALKLIDFFADDLKDLKVRLFHFEEKYLTGRRDPAGRWASDFIELSQGISSRLQMEHAQLFPLIVSKGTSVAS
jgi:hypothetical protein